MSDTMHFDLLFGRVRVFAQLDYDKLFELAGSKGVEMTWATHRDLGKLRAIGKLIPGSPNAPGVNATLIADRNAHEILLIGFFSRVLLEFMSPSQLLSLVIKGLERARH